VGDRLSPKDWAEQGSTDIVERAKEKVGEILGSHYPGHIPNDVDEQIRQRLTIRLPREYMRSGAD
jgi:trimethylamine--corrinoid protein Co-methyltransferase